MEYIIIEDFDEPELVRFSNGNVRIFNSIWKAKLEAKQCQDAKILPLSNDLINLLREFHIFVDISEAGLANMYDTEKLKEKIEQYD